MRLVTGLSLAANTAGAALAAVVVRKKGLAPIVRAIRPPRAEPVPYARLARERFADLPGAPVVLMGDSQAQGCPAGELFGRVAVRGIGGQTIAEVHGWLDLVLADPQLERLIVWAGTNDVLLGHDGDRIGADMAALLRDAAGRDVQLVVLSVPPLTGHETAVQRANDALQVAAEKADAVFVDLSTALAGGMADDGVHISPAGYARLRTVADQVAG
jgi:hypothetical protein